MLRTIMNEGILIFLGIFENWVYYQIIYRTILDREELSRKTHFMINIIIIVWGILISWNRNLIFFSDTVFWLSLISNITIVWGIKRKQLLLIIGITTTYYSLVALLDFFYEFFSIAIIGEEFVRKIFWHGCEPEKVVVYLWARVSIYLLYERIKKYNWKRDIREFQSIFLMSGFIFSFLVRRYQIVLADMFMGEREVQGKSGMISLIFILIVLLFFIFLWMKNKLLEKENSFLMIEESIGKQKYYELKETLDRNRELVHDTKNHYLVIQEYLENEEYEKLQNYVKQVSSDFVKANPEIYTGLTILDLILRQKKIHAEEKGIQYRIQTTPVVRLYMEEQEICSLFGNLLDNAIEACSPIKDAEKRIEIKIKQFNQMLSIKISNTFEIPPKKKDGFFESLKENKKEHGYGLKIVQRIVERYEGVITYEEDGNTFIVKIFFGMG